jgi:hypothetical protein
VDEQPTLPAEVRASLPSITQAYIAFQESQIALFRDQVAALQATVTKHQGQIADLQARAHQDSGNSSRPPSSDPPSARPHLKRTLSGRIRGGQKGHPGHAWILSLSSPRPSPGVTNAQREPLLYAANFGKSVLQSLADITYRPFGQTALECLRHGRYEI